jgi:hypothetical protein
MQSFCIGAAAAVVVLNAAKSVSSLLITQGIQVLLNTSCCGTRAVQTTAAAATVAAGAVHR